MTDVEHRRQAFERLRILRERAGSSGRDFAEMLGWAPSKVSKIETGKQAPTDADLTTWLRAAFAEEQLDDLTDELRNLPIEYSSWRRQLRVGYPGRQEEAQRVERDATTIRAVEFDGIPGQVQIPEYARWIFTLHAELQQTSRDIDQAVTARMARQTVLYDPAKRVEVLVAEAALRYPTVPPDVMRAQLDRLGSLIRLPNVRIGLLPLNRRMPYMPMHGYLLIDEDHHHRSGRGQRLLHTDRSALDGRRRG